MDASHATTISPEASSPLPPPRRRGTPARPKQPLTTPPLPPSSQRRRSIVSNLNHDHQHHWTGTRNAGMPRRIFPPCRRPPRPPCLPDCTSCPIHQNPSAAKLPKESSIFVPDSYHMTQGIVKLELKTTKVRVSSSTVVLANYHNDGWEKNVQPLPVMTPVLPLVLEAIDATDKVSVHILKRRTIDRNKSEKDDEMVARRVSRYSDRLDKVMEKTRQMTKAAYPLVPSNPPPRFFPRPFSIKKVMLRTKGLTLRRRMRLRRLAIERRQHAALVTIHSEGEEGTTPPPPAKSLLLAVMKSMKRPLSLEYADEEGFEGSMDVMCRNYMVAFKKLLWVTKELQLGFDRKSSM